MPGGLTRVADGTDPRAPWLELGDVSKDTWVLSDQPVEQFSLLAQRQASQRLAPRRPRFAEPHGRQPVLARPLYGARGRRRALAAQSRDPPGRRDGLDAHARVARARRRDADRAEAPVGAPRPPRDAGRARSRASEELWTILFDPECKDGLATVLGNVQRNAEAVRERLSFDTFRILRDLTEVSQSWELSPGPRDRRRAAPLESAHSISGGVQRHGRREHDARLRLAVPRHGPPPRAHARDDSDDSAARRARRRAGRRRARAAARARGQHDDLSRALSSRAAACRPCSTCCCATRRIRARPCTRSSTLDEHIAHLPSERGRRHPDGRSTPRDAPAATSSSSRIPSSSAAASARFDTRIELDRLMRRIERDVHELSDHIAERFFSHSSPTRVGGAGAAEADACCTTFATRRRSATRRSCRSRITCCILRRARTRSRRASRARRSSTRSPPSTRSATTTSAIPFSI